MMYDYKLHLAIRTPRACPWGVVREVKQSIFEDNNKDADLLRQECKGEDYFLWISSVPASMAVS